jgi:hypothetical protein
MKRSSVPRKTANLSQSTNHQLHMYALAASAAGVGILALAQAAEAKIIYRPANVSINPHVPYKLDLNHDGTADFTFSIYTFSHSGSGGREFIATMTVRGAQKSNAVVVGSKGFARAFGPGIRIGPKAAVKGYALMGHCLIQRNSMSSVNTSKGNWLNVTNRYLGLRFTISGKIHFGWARLTVAGCAVKGNLTGYAYETIPNKPIVTGKTKGPDQASIEESNPALNLPTPEPATLGALAMGVHGLSIWRRKESVLVGD